MSDEMEQMQFELRKAVIEAVAHDAAHFLVQLLQSGIDISAMRFLGTTSLLHIAAATGALSCVSLFLELGFDIDVRDAEGDSPLICSLISQSPRVDVAMFLIASGANVNHCNNINFTALMAAAKAGCHDVIEALVQKGADVNTVCNEDGSTALILAASKGNQATARFLVQHGAAVAPVLSDGRSALHLACQRNLIPLARFLLEHGADVSVRDCKNNSALDLASPQGRAELLEVLQAKGMEVPAPNDEPKDAKYVDEDEAAANAGASDDNEVKPEDVLREILLVHNFRRSDAAWKELTAGPAGDLGATAIFRRNVFVLEKLIHDNLLNVKSSQAMGAPLLHVAVSRGDPRIIKCLLVNGAEVNEQDGDGDTPLHNLCLTQSFLASEAEILELLIEHGADPLLQSGNGNFAIHFAAGRAHVELIKALLKHGSPVNARNRVEAVPLHIAASSSSPNAVRACALLLRSGANLEAVDNDLWTPLCYAVRSGNIAIATLFLQMGANVNCQDSFGNSALYLACQTQNLDMMQLLMDYDADVNLSNRKQYTPLHWAAYSTFVEIAFELLKRGAKTNLPDEEGRTAIDVAPPLLARCLQYFDARLELTATQKSEIAQRLWTTVSQAGNIWSNSSPEGELLLAASSGDCDVVQARIASGVSVDVPNSSGFRPLFMAIANHRLPAVQKLIELGASVHITDEDGDTALHVACFNDQEEMVPYMEVLLAAGANVNAVNHRGWTPLRVAVRKAHMAKVVYLLEHGADPALPDRDGYGALHNAVALTGGMATPIVEKLLEHGAPINSVSRNNDTPLILAIKNCPTLVPRFLELGADPNIAPFHGLTALANAVQIPGDDPALVELLIKHGANVNKVNSRHYTALHFAVANGSLNKIDALLSHGADPNVRDQDGHTPFQFSTGVVRRHLMDRFRGRDIVYAPLNDVLDMTLQQRRIFTDRSEEILAACRSGTLATVRMLFDRHMIDYDMFLGSTFALHAAVEGGNTAVVDFLLSKGVQLSNRNSIGDTPLIIAVGHRHEAIAVTLVEKGADVNCVSNSGVTALLLAVERNFVKLCTLLIECGANVNVDGGAGCRPLHLAAKTNPALVRILVANGANVNAVKDDGWTPLHVAAVNNEDAVEILIEHGADVCARTSSGHQPYELISMPHVAKRFTDTLRKVGTPVPPYIARTRTFDRFQAYFGMAFDEDMLNAEKKLLEMHSFATSDHGKLLEALREGPDGEEEVERLLSCGVDVNVRSTINNAPLLLFAVVNNSIRALRLLLDAGADMSACDSNERSALHHAILARSEEATLELLRRGADVDVEDENGVTPALLCFGRAFSTEASAYVAARCKDVNRVYTLGKNNEATLLHCAAASGCLEQLQILVQYDLNLEVRVVADEVFGETPLMVAIKEGQLEAARFLLEHGASPVAQDNKQRTPIMFAAREGREEMVQLVAKYVRKVTSSEVEYLAAVNNQSDDGWTAMHIAAAMGKLDLMRLLRSLGLDPDVETKAHEKPSDMIGILATMQQ